MSGPPPPRRLRIAIVIEHVNRQAGQERVIAELVGGLAGRHEIDLYCFSARDIPEPQVRIRRLWCPLRSNTFQAWWIQVLTALLLRPRRYDVVLSQGGNCLVQNFVYAHTSHALRYRSLLRDPYQQEPSRRRRLLARLRARWARAMERRALRRCPDRTLAMSAALAQDLAANHGLRLQDIQVAPLGVDHAVFNPQVCAELRDPVRAELGLGPQQILLLFVGGLWHGKGLPLILEAMGRLALPALRLLVVGRGDEAQFRELARTHGVEDRVQFVGESHQVQRYYAAADIFVFPTQVQNYALVMGEAAACGLPLVMTRTGDTEALFPDEECALLIRPQVEELAEALGRLATAPDLRRRLGEGARRAAQALTWDRHNRLVEAFLLRRTEPSAPLSSPAADRLRVAVLSHSCVVDANQRLYVEMAARCPDLELMVIAPHRWRNSLGGALRFRSLAEADGLVHPLPVALAGRIHLHLYLPGPLRRSLARFRPHLVLADAEAYSLVTWQAARLARRLGAGAMLYAKQNLARRHPPPFPRLQRWVLGQVRQALAISPEAEQVLRVAGYAGPVTVVPHAVDAARCPTGRNTGLRERLGLQPPLVGFVGRLEAHKGVLDLLEAVALLSEQRAGRVALLIVGDGPQRRMVEDLAARRLGPKQARVTGYVEHQQIPDYLRAMDVLALPSRTTPGWKEQFGRVVLEALACEVPVVGSDSGNIPHLLRHTGGGLVFPEGDVRGLAEKLAWVLDHPEQAAALAAQGRKVVEEEYGLDRAAYLMAEACRRAAGRTGLA